MYCRVWQKLVAKYRFWKQPRYSLVWQVWESAIFSHCDGKKSWTLLPEENASTPSLKRQKQKTSSPLVTKPCNWLVILPKRQGWYSKDWKDAGRNTPWKSGSEPQVSPKTSPSTHIEGHSPLYRLLPEQTSEPSKASWHTRASPQPNDTWKWWIATSEKPATKFPWSVRINGHYYLFYMVRVWFLSMIHILTIIICEYQSNNH